MKKTTECYVGVISDGIGLVVVVDVVGTYSTVGDGCVVSGSTVEKELTLLAGLQPCFISAGSRATTRR